MVDSPENLLGDSQNLWFLIGLGLAFLPAAAIGFLTHSWIKTHLFTPQTVAASSIVGGLIILAVEARRDQARVHQLEQVSLTSAFWIGVAQCASLLPGMSRSGSTIIGGLLVGLDRKVATEYSFFLALPTLIVATCYQMWKSRDVFRQDDYLALGIGMLVSFVVAWIVIAAFLSFVKRHTLRPFAYYRILMGIVVFYIFGFSRILTSPAPQDRDAREKRDVNQIDACISLTRHARIPPVSCASGSLDEVLGISVILERPFPKHRSRIEPHYRKKY